MASTERQSRREVGGRRESSPVSSRTRGRGPHRLDALDRVGDHRRLARTDPRRDCGQCLSPAHGGMARFHRPVCLHRPDVPGGDGGGPGLHARSGEGDGWNRRRVVRRAVRCRVAHFVSLHRLDSQGVAHRGHRPVDHVTCRRLRGARRARPDCVQRREASDERDPSSPTSVRPSPCRPSSSSRTSGFPSLSSSRSRSFWRCQSSHRRSSVATATGSSNRRSNSSSLRSSC